jgi:hypothetical protein
MSQSNEPATSAFVKILWRRGGRSCYHFGFESTSTLERTLPSYGDLRIARGVMKSRGRAARLTVPPPLLARADELIE